MSDNDPDLAASERRLFAALPREMAGEPHTEDDLVRALRAQGFFRPRAVTARSPLFLVAAAVTLMVVAVGGALVGGRLATRASLEAMIARDDLSIADRILVLQRAGSAYVQAAHAYADATAQTDSTAVEVAQQVLRGAAHAVVRSRLDAGVAARLTAVLHDSLAQPTTHQARIIWY